MKKMFLALIFLSAFFILTSCKTEPPTKVVVKPDTDVVVDNNNKVTDSDVVVDEDNVVDETNDVDNGGGSTPSHCSKDIDCKSGGDKSAICVLGKCNPGCKSDDDCKSVPGTRCNIPLGRCLNLAATNGACDTKKCPSGCCYALKGFTEVRCSSTAKTSICGICRQGEIFLEGKECVSAACSASNDKCPQYNSNESDSQCFKCETGELICKKDANCNTGTGGVIYTNVQKCISAGQMCVPGQKCCSGQPCIQGFCY